MNFTRPLALVLLVFGCGGGDPVLPETREEACAMVAGCADPEVQVPGPRQAIFRVLVARSPDGSVRIEKVNEVEVSATIGAPQGPLSGTHGLAGLDAEGNALEFQFLKFADELVFEDLGGSEPDEVISLADSELNTVGYVTADPLLAEIALINTDGDIVARQAPPAPGTDVISDGVGASRESLLQPSGTSACSHVLLLEAGDMDELPPSIYDEYPPLTPGPLQYAVVKAALGRMTPMLCAGLSRILFTDIESTTTGGWVGRLGDIAFINVNVLYEGVGIDEASLVAPAARARLTHVILHETAHTVEFLLGNATDARVRPGAWMVTQRNIAEETIDNTRLNSGMNKAIRDLHQRFVSLGWAEPYTPLPAEPAREGELARLLAQSPTTIAQHGAMSAYGGTNVNDDFAEMVAHPISEPVLRGAGADQGRFLSPGCIAMRAYTDPSVPQGLAAVFTKLSFVRDLGLISDENFRSCAGSSIGLTGDGEGFTVLQGGEVRRRFTSGVEAGIGTQRDRYVFSLSADGMVSYAGADEQATITLRLELGDSGTPLDQISWPRGVYELGALVSPHTFTLASSTEPAANFLVSEGYALVTEATNERLVGSVVVSQVRPLDIAIVPDTYDPPLVFRFVVTN